MIEINTMTKELASIMMVTYNRIELTKQTIENILQVTRYPFELIIVDNHSTDNTLKYIFDTLGDAIHNHEFFKSFKVQKNDKNLGIAWGRNQALQMAEGNWLATLDNDVLLPHDWLSNCIDILNSNPKYGMIGVNFENVIYPIVRNSDLEWQDKPRGNLGTACTVFNRSLHQLLGYFNTEMGLYGEEDADFGFRVRVIGLKLGYLKQNGKHLGEGENDIGEYRAFKTASHQANLKKFNENCAAYANNRKSLYIPFKK